MTHARKLLLAAAAIIAAAAGARAQTTPPAFEVASVKPSKLESRGVGFQFLPGGRLVISNFPLVIIIATAYNLPFQSSRLTGGPEWIRAERYDIEATAEKGAIPAGMSGMARKLKMELMLQTLLADRFKLAVRREAKEMQAYAVVVAKDGPKLEKSKFQEKDCAAPLPGGASCHEFTGGQGRGLHGQAVGMADLVLYVENWAERPVIDRTGLQGFFHIETSPWLPVRPGPLPPTGAKAEDGSNIADLPSLFDVFTRMGLRLEAQKASVETFEITHVEKPVQN